MILSTPLKLFKQTFKAWQGDNAMRLSAALAYYSVFSLAPLLLISISVAGIVFGEEAARGVIEGQLEGSIGESSAIAVQEMIDSARSSGNNVFMTFIGSALLLFTASGVFAQLKEAMNVIWEVRPNPSRGIFNLVKARLLSFSMVIVVAFLLLISLVLSAALGAATDWLGSLLTIPVYVWQCVAFVISVGMITVLFAMIFKILPDAKVEWRDVWLGGFLTAVFFTIGQFLLALYLGREETASTYGAAGAFILLLLWIYYTTNILLFGAEFTKTYAEFKNRRIRPAKGAIPLEVTQKDVG
ncbi:MAG: YihY/virulence factor BrkB family protein [Akkermansiaceae bacterium]